MHQNQQDVGIIVLLPLHWEIQVWPFSEKNEVSLYKKASGVFGSNVCEYICINISTQAYFHSHWSASLFYYRTLEAVAVYVQFLFLSSFWLLEIRPIPKET